MNGTLLTDAYLYGDSWVIDLRRLKERERRILIQSFTEEDRGKVWLGVPFCNRRARTGGFCLPRGTASDIDMEKAGSSEVRPYSFGAAEDSPRSFPVSDRKGNGAKENYP